MEDFYHTSPVDCRPQILALTASPGVRGCGQPRADLKGALDDLCWLLDAHLITVADHLRQVAGSWSQS